MGPADSLQQSELEMNTKNQLIAKGNAISQRIMDIYSDNLNYYLSLQKTKYYRLIDQDMNQALYIMQAMSNILKQTNQKELAAKAEKQFMEFATKTGNY
jgi:hypothetical protein